MRIRNNIVKMYSMMSGQTVEQVTLDLDRYDEDEDDDNDDDNDLENDDDDNDLDDCCIGGTVVEMI